MDCSKTRSLFSPYTDGELEDKARALVDRHIRECEDCRTELGSYMEFLSLLSDKLKAAGERHIPVSKTLKFEQGPPSDTKGRGVNRFLLPVVGLAAAVLVVLLLRPYLPTSKDTGIPYLMEPRRTISHVTEPAVQECEWMPVSQRTARELCFRDILILPYLYPGFSLEEVSFSVPATCGHRVRLCYDSDEGPIVLEQSVDYRHKESCHRTIEMVDFRGCLIRSEGTGCPELIWHSGSTRFSLTAEVSESEIIELARFINKASSEQMYD